MERLVGLFIFSYLCIIETHAVKSATILLKEKATRRLNNLVEKHFLWKTT
jgi:hypothetical protein